MAVRRIVERCLLVSVCAAAAMLLGAVAGHARAYALEPWWHVNTVSAPASSPGGEGRMVVEVSNIGDAMVNATEHPVRIVDQLPAGVTPLHAYGEGGGGSIGKQIGASFVGQQSNFPCSLAGQTVTCTYAERLLAYERFMIAITVKVDPGMGTGVNDVSVSGGGAPQAVSRRALALGDSAPPYGAESYELTPEEEGGAPDAQAGSHPFQLTTTFTFNTEARPVHFQSGETLLEVQPVALTKDLRFKLPPGLVGNPTPLPKCSAYAFTHDARGLCPADTVVGVATAIVTNINFSAHVPLAETVPLYSVEPSVGEPARFGFDTLAGPVVLDTSVDTGGDYGVVVTVPDILDSLEFIGSQVTFWGVPGDPRHDTTRASCLHQLQPNESEPTCPVVEKLPLLIMPTSCAAPLQTSVEGDSWENIGQFTEPFVYTFQEGMGESYALDGCNRLNFQPSVEITPDGQRASSPTGLTVGVHVDQEGDLNPQGLAQSSVMNTTVALPAGVVLNPAGADGLLSCGLGEIGLHSSAEQTCPEAAKVGTVEIETPLLPHRLEGAAYLATSAPSGEPGKNPFNSLLAIYLAVKDPVSGVIVKLPGQVTLCESVGEVVEGMRCEAQGQLISTFKDTPQLPFENLRIHFFGGSRSPLGTPPYCGSYDSSASISPWSGNPPAQIATPPFEISSGPNGTPCADPLPFSPELTTGSLNLQAGAFTPFTMTMSREDGNQNLDAIQLHMPLGLTGTLAGVKLCDEADANAGTCGPESLIGETTVSVGLGSNPYAVKGGRVYITEKYEGAPFGLSIVNPAKAGPFDLGQVIVRAKIEVNPATAALTVTSDSTGEHRIPTILDGIPLQIKHVNVTIGRPGFMLNPTDCNKTSITGSLTSSQGAISSLSVPFQVTNCATLAFKPSFGVSTSGRTTRRLGASLDVKLAMPSAPAGTQANIAKVKVELPKQLPTRVETVQQACPDTVFNANPAACPAASRVGTATTRTPIVPVPLSGPVYFVSHGAREFPDLDIILQGYGVTVDLRGQTFIKKGIITTTFETVPDVPVGTFELTLPQGPYSALTNNGSLCNVKRTVTVSVRVRRRVNGHLRWVRVKRHKQVRGQLVMPTTLTAQNGIVINRGTVIKAVGCPKAHGGRHNALRKARKKK